MVRFVDWMCSAFAILTACMAPPWIPRRSRVIAASKTRGFPAQAIASERMFLLLRVLETTA